MMLNTGTRLNQVKAYLIEYIHQNHLKRNAQLPSEASIAKTLGISRNTLREAYVSLEKDGLIIRRHGIGTFIAHLPVIQDSLNEFFPFAQIIRDVGYQPDFQTLSITFEQAPNEIYPVFDLPSSEKIRCIRRLVFADQKPVIYVEDYLSPIVEAANLNWEHFDGNMVQFLSASLDTQLHQIQSCIRAAALSPENSKYLQLAEGTPILSVRSIIYTVDNQPVTFSKVCFNSDIVELNIVRSIRTN